MVAIVAPAIPAVDSLIDSRGTYSATKFAVRGLTEALEMEWQRHDIGVSALWPLFVDTDMLSGVSTGTTTALGVHLTAEQIAQAAWEALHRDSRVPKVHYPVGSQTKAVYYLSQVSPTWVTRLVNKRLAL